MALRVLIVDDEPLARERVRNCLADLPDVEILGECVNGTEALSAIVERRPDAVFLDVQMPGLTGFEVLRSLPPDIAPAIIFTTAHDAFALEAFEVNAIDYLLKPFKIARFRQAVEKARQLVSSTPLRPSRDTATAGGPESPEAAAHPNHRLASWLEQHQPIAPGQRRLMVKTNDRVLFPRLDEIEWIEAAGNYAILHIGKENHLLRETMANLESQLPPELFFRVSRSGFIHLQRIRELQPLPGGQYMVILQSGQKVTMTRPLRALQERLGAS